MTFGTVTAFLQIIDQIKAPFRNMSGLLPQYYSMTASAERLMELEALPEEEYYTDIQDVERYYEDFQEICLEDATFLSEAPILLLDECTSALDSDTEEQLLENLKQLEHRTILCISHKDATIHSCDEIVRLEDYHFVRVR